MSHSNNPIRRIASNQVITPTGHCMTLQVLELRDGLLVDLYPLTHEMANTQWFQGEIVLRKCDDGAVRAYYKGKPIT